MQIEIHGTPSFSRKGKRGQLSAAQVTVLVGEGADRRSLTRHIKLVNGDWFGLNPDQRAIPLNERYVTELTEAKSNLASAETALATLQKKLKEVGDVDPSKVNELEITTAKAMLEGMIETVELEITTAIVAVNDAEAAIVIVQRELPLEVAFAGPGLTN